MNSMLNAANGDFGSIGGNFDRSASVVDRISEGGCSGQAVNTPYT